METNDLRFVYFVEKLFYHRHVVTVNDVHYAVRELGGKKELCELFKSSWGDWVFHHLSKDITELANLVSENCFTDNGKIENNEFIEGIKVWEATQKDCFDDFKKACEGEF